jgi:hypothetical protein
VSTGHALEIGLLTPFLVPLILMSRVAWMLARIRLLVDAVQVAAASLPDVDDIVRGCGNGWRTTAGSTFSS